METTNSYTSTTSSQSSYFHNPLFYSVVTFYILILLYLPPFFLKIIPSPLLISTLILLLSLLRLGASQQQQEQLLRRRRQQQPSVSHAGGALAPPHDLTEDDLDPIGNGNQPSTEGGPKVEPEPEPNRVVNEPKQEVEGGEDVTRPACITTEPHATVEPGPRPEPEDDFVVGSERVWSLGWAEPEPVFSPKRLVEWDVGAPLEVIYEAYEGEEDSEEAKNDAFCKNEGCGNIKGGILLERYPSLSRYYPDSDSNSDSESSSTMSWDEELEDKEGSLIEIALDYNGFGDKKVSNNNVMRKVFEKEEFCIDDEDNLIEINIFPTKNMADFAW